MHCILISKQILNNFKEFSDRPKASNFDIDKLCGRQSNAFDRSIRIAAINLLSSKAFFQSSIILSKAV